MKRFTLALTLVVPFAVSLLAIGSEKQPLSPLFRSIDLNIGESRMITLPDGSDVTIQLVNVKEKRDPVRQALRGAEVTVNVNDVPCVLPCGENVPFADQGRRNTDRLPGDQGLPEVLFQPLGDRQGREVPNLARDWSIDSPGHISVSGASALGPGAGTLFDNEIGDGETAGPERVYYHQGFDFGGADRIVPVFAATDGVIVSARGAVADGVPKCIRPRYDVVYLRDPRGWYYRCSHFDSIDAAVQVGSAVSIGQQIGVLGKEGASGGWSHLHFELIRPQENGRYGSDSMYAFLHQVYQAQNDEPVIAVARPQMLGFAGQIFLLDGSRSWSASGREGMRYEWRFEDGSSARGAKVERIFTEAGQFRPTLKVTDAKGNVDYDFAKVTVADPKVTPKQRCSLHASYWPTLGICAGDEVAFLARSFRFQPAVGEETWDFGDGSPNEVTQSDGSIDARNKDGYAITKHRFSKPGYYIVTVTRGNSNGHQAVDKLDVRVGHAR